MTQVDRYKINIETTHLLFLLIFTQISVAQKTDMAGYVVTHAGDTVNGMFTAARWDVSPKQFSFKGPRGNELFKPLDVKLFYVAGEFYESAIVDVDHSTGNLQSLNYSSSLNLSVTRYLFGYFQGSKSLYYYKNANGWKYFFKK